MNTNVLQRCKQHDYPFVCRLLAALFDEETLRRSTASDRSLTKTAYARLDNEKCEFMENIFKERVGNDKARFQSLPKMVNMRCGALRNRLKPRK